MLSTARWCGNDNTIILFIISARVTIKETISSMDGGEGGRKRRLIRYSKKMFLLAIKIPSENAISLTQIMHTLICGFLLITFSLLQKSQNDDGFFYL